MGEHEPPRADRSAESTEGQAPSSGDGRGAPGVVGELSEVMRQVARSLQEEHGDVEATLHTLTETAVGLVPGAEEGTVTYVLGRRRVEPQAATGDLPQQVDEMQNAVQEGPCLDAVWEHETVRVDDMRTETRWPRFAAEAAALGVLSSLSLQLFVEGATSALSTSTRGSPAPSARSPRTSAWSSPRTPPWPSPEPRTRSTCAGP